MDAYDILWWTETTKIYVKELLVDINSNGRLTCEDMGAACGDSWL